MGAYTTDISSAETCPTYLSWLAAGMVMGMCMGGGNVSFVGGIVSMFDETTDGPAAGAAVHSETCGGPKNMDSGMSDQVEDTPAYRVCYELSVVINFLIICIVGLKWRDVAPTKPMVWEEANPFAGVYLFRKSTALFYYAILIFMASFALNIYTSTLAHYTETFLCFSKNNMVALGVEWA